MDTTLTTARTNANDNYQQFTGTERWYKHLAGYTYTDGVKKIATDCGAYWFIDLIVSYHRHPKVRDEEFQTWKLSRVTGSTFIAEATDGNDNTLVKQKISYSDFSFDEVTFWSVNKVIMLPTEY